MNDMYLSTDDRDSFQSHFSELSRRLTSIIILIVILTLVWSFSIDQILNFTLKKLDPCEDSCINIFSPEEWAGTRWLSAGLLAILTSGPFIIIQSYGFAKPGLLPSERKAFLAWLISFWLISIITLLFTLTILIPEFYQYGHSFNAETGLVGKYDAAEMLKISIAITWATILILASTTIVIIAGKLQLLWSGNSEWWRLRIHGMMLMLIWIILPNSLPGLFIGLTLLASGMVEIIGYKQFRKPMPIGYGMKDMLDKEGKLHRVLYADCSCFGTSPKIEPLSGMGVLEMNAVCRSVDEQNLLLDTVKRFNVNQVIFSGCKIDSFAPQFIDTLRFLGCSFKSLDLSHLDAIRTDGSLIDCKLAMASLTDPWSYNQVEIRLKEILLEYNIEKIYHGSEIQFGMNLMTNEGFIKTSDDEIIKSISKVVDDLTYVSN